MGAGPDLETLDYGVHMAKLARIVKPQLHSAMVAEARIRLRQGERDVSLTAKEYALLEYLARRAGDVVSRADIAEHVWDEHYDPLSNIVDVYVQRLRRKLDRPGSESLIRTRRGEGYQLIWAAEADS